MDPDHRTLAVVVGNTNARLVLLRGFDVDDRIVIPRARFDAAVAAGDIPLPEFWPRVDTGVVCSVVPSLTDRVHALLEQRTAHACIVDAAAVRSMRLSYAEPASLGADRLCAALAARQLYGAPCAVFDLGTATTLNVVDAAGDFVGGFIAPGIGTGFRALHAHTALLPVLDAGAENPPALVADNTGDAIRAGVLWSAWLLLSGSVSMLRVRHGDELRVVLTGGHARDVLALQRNRETNAGALDAAGGAGAPVTRDDGPQRAWIVDEDLVARGAAVFARDCTRT